MVVLGVAAQWQTDNILILIYTESSCMINEGPVDQDH